MRAIFSSKATVTSFPRKRESREMNPKASAEDAWMPAYAGMTAPCLSESTSELLSGSVLTATDPTLSWENSRLLSLTAIS